MVFLGWDPAARGFYGTVVDLCQHCGGWGEDLEADTFCVYCQAEGVNWAGGSESRSGVSLDELAALLERQQLPFPEYVRADLEHDRQTNAANLLYDYDLDPRRGQA
jgi:hypothetical protein